MTTTDTLTTNRTTATRVAPATGANWVTASLQSAKRTILQFFRTPQLLMLGTVQGALFLFMFRYIFGGAINPGGGLDYVDFLVPGFLVTGILWLGMPASSGVAEDATTGVHDRLRSLPIPRSSVMFGRSIADTALTLWGLLITGVLAFVFGFRLHADALDVLLAVALLVIATYSFMWVFITIGLVSSSAQAANGMATLLVIPVAFISAAYVPADSLPSWLQPVADNQPFTVLSNALRSLTLGGTDAVGIGHTTTHWVVLSLVWCAGIFLVFSSIAVSGSRGGADVRAPSVRATCSVVGMTPEERAALVHLRRARDHGPRVRRPPRRPGDGAGRAHVAGALLAQVPRRLRRDALLVPHDAAHRAGEGASASGDVGHRHLRRRRLHVARLVQFALHRDRRRDAVAVPRPRPP